jgi:hypothetical protein
MTSPSWCCAPTPFPAECGFAGCIPSGTPCCIRHEMRSAPPASIYASTLTRRQNRSRRRSRRARLPLRLLAAYAALVPLAVAAAERVLA